MRCAWSPTWRAPQAGNPRSMTSTDLFDAATIGGARALGRDDIGRLAPGCRADLVLVDVHPSDDAAGARSGAQPDLRRRRPRGADGVSWMGSKVVEDGRVLTMDYPAAAAALHEAQARVKANVPTLDWAHRTAEAISPPTFRIG